MSLFTVHIPFESHLFYTEYNLFILLLLLLLKLPFWSDSLIQPLDVPTVSFILSLFRLLWSLQNNTVELFIRLEFCGYIHRQHMLCKLHLKYGSQLYFHEAQLNIYSYFRSNYRNLGCCSILMQLSSVICI